MARDTGLKFTPTQARDTGLKFTPTHERVHETTAKAGVASHHADVPARGGGGHGGNPNHDEHGRFT